MFNIPEIVKQNRSTFYNFSTNEPLSLWRSTLAKIMCSILFAILFCQLNKDYLNALITIYAILIGFSFNVLFYLLSTNKIQASPGTTSLEKQLKIEKLNKLSNELFYNVSYFNIVSLSLVVTSLVFFIVDSRIPQFFRHIGEISFIKPISSEIEPYLIYVRVIILFIYRLMLYYLIIESLFSFTRAIERVTFYFRQKLLLEDSD